MNTDRMHTEKRPVDMRSVFLAYLNIAKRRVSHTIDYKQKRKVYEAYELL